jgi:PAS domain S-box-containing protein
VHDEGTTRRPRARPRPPTVSLATALETVHPAHGGVRLGCELLRIIFNSISDGVFTVDREFAITSFNRAAERITGFSVADAIGKRCYEIFRTEVCHRQCALRDALNHQAPVENARVHIISHGGVEKPILVNATVLREKGEVVGAVEFFRDLSMVEDLDQRLAQHRATDGIVSSSNAMRRIIETLPNIAKSDCSVLIAGPSGSGKEVVAQAIHSMSPRRYGPYVKVNCAALPATLLESELFGYVRGAFTDARRDKLGQFALANGGTLLLDEISEMDVSLQVKLLRVLNNGEYQPLGSTKALRTDARVIAATNANLGELIEAGRFRADLFFRINVVTIDLPPLRERPEDIPLLTSHFLCAFVKRTGKLIRSVSPSAMRLLCSYDYPGNVRELENAIEHAFVMCEGDVIAPEHLPSQLSAASPTRGHTGHVSEKSLVGEALRRHGGNRTRTAEELGIHRTTLWRKMKEHGLE